MTSPLIELHVHLEGTVGPATLLAAARRNGEPLPADTVAGLAELYTFRDFAHFIDVWNLTIRCLRTAEDFRQLVVDYAARAAAEGTVYLEGIFTPDERVVAAIGWDALYAGYCDGAAEARERHGVDVRLTPEACRGSDVDFAEAAAMAAVRYRDRGVVGFGLSGREDRRPTAPYLRAMRIAADGGLGLVPHAGEAAGPAVIREALAFGAHRIRHGIRAVEDPDLVAELAGSGVVLDVTLTSNLRTRVVGALADHPLPALVAAGVRCSISTDDPAMFGTDLPREYALAAELGVPASDVYSAGVAGALCDEATRTSLLALAPTL